MQKVIVDGEVKYEYKAPGARNEKSTAQPAAQAAEPEKEEKSGTVNAPEEKTAEPEGEKSQTSDEKEDVAPESGKALKTMSIRRNSLMAQPTALSVQKDNIASRTVTPDSNALKKLDDILSVKGDHEAIIIFCSGRI